MANEEAKILVESYPMIGGDSDHSYAKNSSYQGELVDVAKEMIYEGIFDKLDLRSLGIFDASGTFKLADLGCSVGPNTFFAVQNMIKAVEQKYYAERHQNTSVLEFQVFFNDHYDNDFNTLFKTLPSSRKYFVAGVPGSFHGRLFPKSSLHFVHSSYALHWLSKVPKEIVDNNSPAWNKGSIQCTGLVKEVAEAYSAQFKNDMECFLNARAQEIVPGGLMVIVLAGLPNGTPMSQTGEGKLYDLFGSCLNDMAKMGLINEEKVDSFNFPLYCPTSKELETVIERNGYFSIERMDRLDDPPMTYTEFSAEFIVSSMRAVFEGFVKQHFGHEFVDQIFKYFTPKVAESLNNVDEKHRVKVNLFALLKRINY